MIETHIWCEDGSISEHRQFPVLPVPGDWLWVNTYDAEEGILTKVVGRIFFDPKPDGASEEVRLTVEKLPKSMW